MHYRNGREAKNGDRVVQISGDGKIYSVGALFEATPGNDYCNGTIAQITPIPQSACLVDCLHVDDVAELLKEKSLHQRPPGK